MGAIAMSLLLLSLPGACMAFGIVSDDIACHDSSRSGIPGHTCAEAKAYCSGSPFSAELHKHCPRTCGECGEAPPAA